MAVVQSSTLQLSNLLFSSVSCNLSSPHKPNHHRFLATRATPDDSSSSDAKTSEDQDSFENRLSQVRLRYRSGAGKKAELRKFRKGKKGTSGSGMYLPPVPLKEPASGGVKVEFGFSPYSERINGRIAILGLSALVLVELATGESVIRFHSPAIILIQVYFVAAVSALYVKFEKEKISVWPESSSN